MKKSNFTAVVLFLLLAMACRSEAASRVWTAPAGTNDWFDTNSWDGGTSIPVAGDTVTVAAAGAALLTNSTPYFSSFALNTKLIFSNWNTTLSATNVTIESGGIITLPGAFTTNQVSNNVWIACSNFMLAAGGKIDADGMGYMGGVGNTDGYGPGAGVANAYGAGAGYGGRGGGSVNLSIETPWPGATPYGSVQMPLDPGSGGGGSSGSGGSAGGGNGGGAVRIEAPGGPVTVNGTITANGTSGAGGGAGGSIYIACRTFDGAGLLSAVGGGGYPWHNQGGGGGGGRIAVSYNKDIQSAVPSARFLVTPGGLNYFYSDATRGDFGTLWLPDAKFISSSLTNVSAEVWGFSSLSFNSFTVNNTWVRFPAEGFQLTVTGDLTVMGSYGMLQIGGSTKNNKIYVSDPRYSGSERRYGPALSGQASAPALNVGGNLVLTNGGSLVLYSALTNAGTGTTNYGALISVTNDVVIGNGSALYPYSHPTNGGSVLVLAKNFTVAAGGGVNANGKGFAAGTNGSARGYGPGASLSEYYFAGAGYGGYGGGGYTTVYGGLPYGSLSEPIDPGSGTGYGGSAVGGIGGGSVWIQATQGTVTVDGWISAGGVGSGASGGGICINCRTFAGSNGLLAVNAVAGGGPHPGGGGGGRIAVNYDPGFQVTVPSVSYQALPGGSITAHAGDIGTIYFPDNRFIGQTIMNINGQLPQVPSLAMSSLTVTNAWVHFPAEGFQLTVTNDLTIMGASGRLELGGSVLYGLFNPVPAPSSSHSRRLIYANSNQPTVLSVGGSLILTNGGVLHVYSGPTNLPAAPVGAAVSVAREIRIATNSYLCPQSHPTNGGSVFFRVNSLLIDRGGVLDADGRGFAGGPLLTNGYGPGHSHQSAYQDGAGYGGHGGNNVYSSGGGITYGSSNAPVDPGSGGGGPNPGPGSGRAGGGLVWVQADRMVMVNGMIAAGCTNGSGCGAGSGGGIYIYCRTFAGSGGLLAARGGDAAAGHNGSGGGGRIAVWRVRDISGGSVVANVDPGITNNVGGATPQPSYMGLTGTIVWGMLPESGTVFVVH